MLLARKRVLAASERVAPVVKTSSTTRTLLPSRGKGSRRAKAPLRLFLLSRGPREVWEGVSRTLTRRGRSGMPVLRLRWRAIRRLWLKPLSLSLPLVRGMGVRGSHLPQGGKGQFPQGAFKGEVSPVFEAMDDLSEGPLVEAIR